MKIKNGIIIVIVCIIVFSSFKIPELLLELENNNMEMEVFDKKRQKNNIDIEAEKIYLVKAIHEIEDGKSIIISDPQKTLLWESVVSTNDNIGNAYEKEFYKLEEANILKDIDLDTSKEGILEYIKTEYTINSTIYEVKHIRLKYDDKDYIFNIENKTGKIIYIAFNKENIYDENNKKEILENYINYLNLYVIDDWKYLKNEMDKKYVKYSKKAKISITLEETKDNYMISFHTSN